MAGADYASCSVCGARCFYDAHINYEDTYSLVCLCIDCAQTFEVVVRRKKSKREKTSRDARSYAKN